MTTILKILYWLWQVGNLFFSQKARDKEIEKLEKRIEEIKHESTKVFTDFIAHTIDAVEYQHTHDRLEYERVQICQQIARLRKRQRKNISITSG